MIKDKEFNLGNLVYTIDIIKVEPEDSLLDDRDPEKRVKVINYFNARIDIKNQLNRDDFQNIINNLEPGSYVLSIELNNKNFTKIEQIDGEVIEVINDQN